MNNTIRPIPRIIQFNLSKNSNLNECKVDVHFWFITFSQLENWTSYSQHEPYFDHNFLMFLLCFSYSTLYSVPKRGYFMTFISVFRNHWIINLLKNLINQHLLEWWVHWGCYCFCLLRTVLFVQKGLKMIFNLTSLIVNR